MKELIKAAIVAGADAAGLAPFQGGTALVVLKQYRLYDNKPGPFQVKTASASLEDYHLVIRRILNKIRSEYEIEGSIYCDTHQYSDRQIARLAGLGFIGRNTFLIHPRLGSAVNIGWLTLDRPVEGRQVLTQGCGNCHRCEAACPVGALNNGVLDRTKCIAAINQQKDSREKDLHDFFYGCDICQRACPYNEVAPYHEGFIFPADFLDNESNRTFHQRYGDRDFAWIGKATLKRNTLWIRRQRMDKVHELGYLKDKIEELKDQGVYRTLPVMSSPSGARVTLNGREGIVNLSSNNYLGFANHPEIKQAAIDATEKYGVGAGAVRTIIGNLDLHEELELKLAEFKREEAVTVYQSGFNCNAGTIQAITDRGDLIISDELNHASIIDGVRLSRADKAVYKHADMADLERVLQESDGKYNTRLIITDGVFSMDGDLAPLPEIVELAEKYGALTYVDDAHGSGVLGENGRGTVDHFGLHGRIDFVIGTLSKALGVIGGYVASKQVTKEWLSHRGRPILFSTSLTPASAGALIKAVEILSTDSQYTDRLWDNANYFKQKLGTLGFNTGHSQSPITPVIIGDEAKTMQFSKALLEAGVFVSAIVFPTVPKGTGRLRAMVTAEHSKEDLDFAVEKFGQVGREMGLID